MNEGEMTLKGLQQTVDSWINTVGGGYFSPLTNMAVLAEETGEVARAMSRIYGDQVAKPGDSLNLADELADILWVVAAIANQTGIDLEDAMSGNIRKKQMRDSIRFQNRDNKEK